MHGAGERGGQGLLVGGRLDPQEPLGRGVEAHGWNERERLAVLEPRERRRGEACHGSEARQEHRPEEPVQVIKKMPNQKGVAEGSTKFWCSGCMKAFVAETSAGPGDLPRRTCKETADEFAAVPKEAEEE